MLNQEIPIDLEELNQISSNEEDQIIFDAIKKGGDIRQFSKQIEDDLRKIELDSIEDCKLKKF